MNRIRQHIPAFVEVEEREEALFQTTAELLEIPFVERWRAMPHFYRFSISDGHYLMAEFSDGTEWWVVGYLREPVEGLPEWKHP